MKRNILIASLLSTFCGVLLILKINQNTMSAPEAESSPTAIAPKSMETLDEKISQGKFHIDNNLAPSPKRLQSNTDKNFISFQVH